MNTPENIVKPTFYGEEVSDYGIEQGFVDYRTIAKCINLVLCNDVVKLFQTFDFERINDNETSGDYEIFQWYIIDSRGAELLEQWLPDEVVYYCEELDLYLWGVTHYGTPWNGVLTPIKIVKIDDGFDFEKQQDTGSDDE